jgi:hypothetical protein
MATVAHGTSWQAREKEVAGRATDNPDLQAEGKGERAKSNLKQAGEKVKDVFKEKPGRQRRTRSPYRCTSGQS